MGSEPVYVSVRQLAELTPWSEDEIDHKIRRGALKRGVHYFQPNGRRGRLIFKWSAIVEYIEGRQPASVAPVPKQVLDVEAAIQRLHA